MAYPVGAILMTLSDLSGLLYTLTHMTTTHKIPFGILCVVVQQLTGFR